MMTPEQAFSILERSKIFADVAIRHTALLGPSVDYKGLKALRCEYKNALKFLKVEFELRNAQ